MNMFATFATVLASMHPARGAQPTLQEIMENLESNERLYANVDVEIECRFHHYNVGPEMRQNDNSNNRGKSAAPRRHVNSVDSVNERHYVNQQNMVRMDYDEMATGVDGKERSATTVSAYDGVRSIYINGNVANVNDARVVSGTVPYSDALFYEDYNCPLPLSTFLATGHDSHNGVDYVWDAGGFVKDGPEDCVVVECTGNYQGKPIWRTKFWLATGKNYIPVKMLSWRFREHPTEPIAEADVTEWKELAKGLWYPARTHTVVYYYPEGGGKRTKRYETDQLVRSITLNPNYPKSYFQPEIPKGTQVYRVVNDKIIDHYIEGELRLEQGEGGRPRHWRGLFLGLNSLIFLGIVIWYFYRRNRHATGS